MRPGWRRHLAWFGTLAILVALAIVVRDVAGPPLVIGGVVIAAIAVVAGVVALALAHVRRFRRTWAP